MEEVLTSPPEKLFSRLSEYAENWKKDFSSFRKPLQQDMNPKTISLLFSILAEVHLV